MNLQIIFVFLSTALQCDAFSRFCRGQNCRSSQLTEQECIVISKDIFNKAFINDPASIFKVGSPFEECKYVDRFYRAYLVEKFPGLYDYRRSEGSPR